ncbi:TonB-dependent receptor [Sphingobium boeckii]|uniref:Outer membrane receptor protein involved in Fe transport n=1 Tax=Sphingobium boeckii TaxID=1082345 RepID=A0A7W9AEW4_9SPHN|nr:TonB-dependent receptor [Sphingobium boeckii]MBB5684345.1 outer membrane receptor protein involved in Fe transport [Sphingobium boeckii]
MPKSNWLISVACLAIAAPAYAQDAPPQEAQDAVTEDSYVNSDIIVTATRRSEALADVPIAVSAVTAESLQNSGASDIRQLNQLAPSLLVSSTGSEANGSARIRGIGTVGDNPGLESSVAVFIDGVYRSRTGAGLNELGEIERVEVLRGPQGTLFGRNASAGLINIISKRPSFEFGVNAEATYGNYDFMRFAGGVTGPITESIAARLDGVYVKRDGFYDNVTQAGGSEGKINDRDRYFLRGQLLFEPNDALSVRLIGDYTHRDESCCGAVYIATKETTDPTANPASTTGGVNPDNAFVYSASNRIVNVLQSLGGTVTYPPQNPYARNASVSPGRTYRNTTKDWGVSGELNYDFGGATLTSISAYRYYKAGGAGDVDYSNVDLTYRADDGNSYRRFKTFTQELRLQGSAFNDKLDWLVGGYYGNEKLQVVDNIKFGSQYGAFAACRIVATVNPAAVLRDPTAPGCLSAAGRVTLTNAFGAAAPLMIGGIDRLSTVNNVGDVRSVYNQQSENYALFTHNIINITDTLNLTLGARYTHEKKDFDADFNNNNTICPAQQAALGPLLGNPALAALAGGIVTLTCTGNSSSSLNSLDLQDSFKDSEWTGTAVLSWKPTDQLLTYASYSKGYKAGGYNLDRSDLGGLTGVFSPRTNADAPGLRFEPEKVDSYEIGLKYNGRKFNLNVAAFRQEFKTFQLNTFNGSIFIVQNIAACDTDLGGQDSDNSPATGACAGKTKPGVISQGVELEASIYPARDVAVTAGYTYADTHYRNNLVGSSSGEPLSNALFLLPGQQLSNAPKHVVTASFAYTPELGSSGLSGLFYVDTRMSSDYNTGSDLFPEKAQDGFTVVNARIGLRGPDQRWAIELWGQNVFNKNYQQVAFNTPFQGAGSIAQTQAFGTTANQLFSSFLAEPRTYGVTVRGKF